MEIKVGHYYRNMLGDISLIVNKKDKVVDGVSQVIFQNNRRSTFRSDGTLNIEFNAKRIWQNLMEEVSFIEVERLKELLYHPEIGEDSSSIVYHKGFHRLPYLNPHWGPHECREMGLMKIGAKPIALIIEGMWDHTWTTACSLYGWETMKVPQSSTTLVATKGEEWRIHALLELFETPSASLTRSVEQRIGDLFGYRVDDIEYYLNRLDRLSAFK